MYDLINKTTGRFMKWRRNPRQCAATTVERILRELEREAKGSVKILLVSCKVTLHKCLQHIIVHQKTSRKTFLRKSRTKSIVGSFISSRILDIIGYDFYR